MHFSFNSSNNARVSNSCIKNSTRAWPTCTYILPEAHDNLRDNERKWASELKLIHVLLLLQLGIAIVCYQYDYENTYFPAPYTDNQLLCSLCGLTEGVPPLILRASKATTGFHSRSSKFCNFTPRIHQKRSHKVRNPKFSWGACPQIPLAGALPAQR